MSGERESGGGGDVAVLFIVCFCFLFLFYGQLYVFRKQAHICIRQRRRQKCTCLAVTNVCLAPSAWFPRALPMLIGPETDEDQFFQKRIILTSIDLKHAIRRQKWINRERQRRRERCGERGGRRGGGGGRERERERVRSYLVGMWEFGTLATSTNSQRNQC